MGAGGLDGVPAAVGQVQQRSPPVVRVARLGCEPEPLDGLHLTGDRRGVQAERGRDAAQPLRPVVRDQAQDRVCRALELDLSGRGLHMNGVRAPQKLEELVLDVVVVMHPHHPLPRL